MPNEYRRIPTCFILNVPTGKEESNRDLNAAFESGELPVFTDYSDTKNNEVMSNENKEDDHELYRLIMDKPLILAAKVSYPELKSQLSIKNSSDVRFRNLVHSLNWKLGGIEYHGLIEDLESSMSAEITVSSSALCSEPEFIELADSAGFDSIVNLKDSSPNFEYRVLKPSQACLNLQVDSTIVPPQLRILVNKYTSKEHGSLLMRDMSHDDLRQRSGIIARDLATFLVKHQVSAKVILTQGIMLEQDPSKNNPEAMVHASVSVGNVIVDLTSKPNENVRDARFLSRPEFLREWKWIVSETEPCTNENITIADTQDKDKFFQI